MTDVGRFSLSVSVSLSSSLLLVLAVAFGKSFCSGLCASSPSRKKPWKALRFRLAVRVCYDSRHLHGVRLTCVFFFEDSHQSNSIHGVPTLAFRTISSRAHSLCTGIACFERV